MRVKLFSMMGKKFQNQQILEGQINQWLSQNSGIEIVSVEQSSSGGSMGPSLWMISIWYNEMVDNDN